MRYNPRVLLLAGLLSGLFLSLNAQVGIEGSSGNVPSIYSFNLKGTPSPYGLDYYFPGSFPYNPAIPQPDSILGYQVGQWHVSHDQLAMYMRILAAASPRVRLEPYARSHEGRLLMVLVITSEKNQESLEEIRKQHLALSEGEPVPDANLGQAPSVIYQGYTIHGNEPSGSNAALLYAWYLAASEDAFVDSLLDRSIILLDPCLNPDGMHRFAGWVNMHKSKALSDDPDSREHNEVWPNGRTNHYWFDLNRDWLPLRHPESQGRLAMFHRWRPNILTDHHEMGTNATYFFQPGVASRTHPLTPIRNYELTGKVAEYHARALDRIGSFYYTRERFDDFYYGKGSTYPDVNGCIGILFEQASSRGHLQSSVNGPVSFPFTIRNQLYTSLSTARAGMELRQDLLRFQSQFYADARDEANQESRGGYLFQDTLHPEAVKDFIQLLLWHQIEVYPVSQSLKRDKIEFLANRSWYVPFRQRQYRLVKAIFEQRQTFKDSLFYDVSAWTLPLAFGLEHASVNRGAVNIGGASPLQAPPVLKGAVVGEISDYAYLIPWGDAPAARLLVKLLQAGIRVKVAQENFVSMVGAATDSGTGQERRFFRGTLMVPVQGQSMGNGTLASLIGNACRATGARAYAVSTGLTPDGIDLGSPNVNPIRTPRILILAGNGTSAYEAGHLWHAMDVGLEIPVTVIEASRLDRMNLSRYTTILMPGGNYSSIGKGAVEKLKTWVRSGGLVIAQRGAVRWLQRQKLASVRFKRRSNSKKGRQQGGKNWRPYAYKDGDNGAQVVGGAILEAKADLTHPLLYGIDREQVAVFRTGTGTVFEPPKNPYAYPLLYQEIVSGYASRANRNLFRGSAGVIACGQGAGRVICFADNMNFRGFWQGTRRIYYNALFFGALLDNNALEKGE